MQVAGAGGVRGSARAAEVEAAGAGGVAWSAAKVEVIAGVRRGADMNTDIGGGERLSVYASLQEGWL